MIGLHLNVKIAVKKLTHVKHKYLICKKLKRCN